MSRSVRQRLRSPWVAMPIVAVLALGGYAFLRPDDATSPTTDQANEQVVEASLGTVAETVTAEGTVAAAETDELSFTSAGTVTAVNVSAGDTVTAGQVLATLDATELAADLADAEAALAEAEAALADDEDARASDAQIEADEASVTAAEDRVAEATEALDGAELTADIDGTVASVDLTVGEELGDSGASGTTPTGSDSGSGLSSGNLGDGSTGLPNQTATDQTDSGAQITVVSAGRYEVELAVDDTDIESITAGQEATISLSTSTSGGFPGGGVLPGGGAFPGGGGFPGGGQLPDAGGNADDSESGDTGPTIDPTTASVTGTVTEVGEVADASSGVASYSVVVTFEDTSGDYNAGATVSVDITIAEQEDVVQVAAFAVTTAEDGTNTVTVRTDDGDEEREVTTGLQVGNMIAITSGLEAGEQVVVSLPDFGGGGGPGGGGPPAAATEERS